MDYQVATQPQPLSLGLGPSISTSWHQQPD